jgi:glycosyltransferase involved in cell wall biosynthesis
MQLKNKKILLISNEIFSYRVPVYNYFFEQFLKHGYEFNVIANTLRESREEIKFNLIIKEFNFNKYKKVINEMDPDFVIFFLHLKDLILWPLIHWLKIKKVPVIYWNHGVNLMDPNNIVKNIFFRYIHSLADSIILYSLNELKYIQHKNRDKTFIANNTLNFNSFPTIIDNKENLKKKYKIYFTKVVLFAGRCVEEKKVLDLIKAFDFIKDKDVGLLIVGEGLKEKYKKIIRDKSAIKYLGYISNDRKLNEIFKLSDIFCIPGYNGLALNQAFFWGLPAITENIRHAPEIIYLRNGENGFIVDRGDSKEIAQKILYLLNNKEAYDKFSFNAKKIIMRDGNIKNMLEGFINSIKFLEKKKYKFSFK